MKILIVLLLFSSASYAKEECMVNIGASARLDDCIHCSGSVQAPGDKADKLLSPLVDLYTNSKEQKQVIAEFKGYELFLNSQKNKSECSNYPLVLAKFNKNFQKELSECEKSPGFLDRKKLVCDWVLSTYNDKIRDSFYAHWSVIGPKGEVKFIPGRTKEQIEGPIRAHEAWCRKVRKNYKYKTPIYCTDITDWVAEFDLVKRVSESMKRDLEKKEEAVPTEAERQRMFLESCKVFENTPATSFTKDLYMECATR